MKSKTDKGSPSLAKQDIIGMKWLGFEPKGTLCTRFKTLNMIS